jgi:hypothetical protein
MLLSWLQSVIVYRHSYWIYYNLEWHCTGVTISSICNRQGDMLQKIKSHVWGLAAVSSCLWRKDDSRMLRRKEIFRQFDYTALWSTLVTTLVFVLLLLISGVTYQTSALSLSPCFSAIAASSKDNDTLNNVIWWCFPASHQVLLLYNTTCCSLTLFTISKNLWSELQTAV